MKLTGKAQICQFLGKPWSVVETWILQENFPASMIAGIWEADSELITTWRRNRVRSPVSTMAEGGG